MRDILVKKIGRTMFLTNDNVLRIKERLWKCSRLKEAKEIWQPKAVLDPRVGSAGEENAIKEIIRLTDKIRLWTID